MKRCSVLQRHPGRWSAGPLRLILLAALLCLLMVPVSSTPAAAGSPPPPGGGEPATGLNMSYKMASRGVVTASEVFTYTIWLVNTTNAAITASVDDPLPSELTYVAGSVTAGGVYSATEKALAWDNVSVPASDHLALQFSVTAPSVPFPRGVTNTASISTTAGTLHRRCAVLVVPAVAPTVNPLEGSYKKASQRALWAGQTMTYTVNLLNSSAAAVTASVRDPLPDPLAYVAGSANQGGLYDAATKAVTWTGVSVPARGHLELSLAVTGSATEPTVITNTATITATNQQTLRRRAEILLLPQPETVPNPLAGSAKTAARRSLAPGQTLTYTIMLHNSSNVDAPATVTDPVPAELAYVADSADPTATYDSNSKTLTWSDVSVPAGDNEALIFRVTQATSVTEQTKITNTATISSTDAVFTRHAKTLLLPAGTAEDTTPPMISGVTIDDKDVLTTPTTTLHITATDNVGVSLMYVREWRLGHGPRPQWQRTLSTGWVPFQADYTWALHEKSGAHFVAVWVADAAGNISHLSSDAIDFASLLLPATQLTSGQFVPYLVYYAAGAEVTATLKASTGAADLYVWEPCSRGAPAWSSTRADTTSQAVSFTAPVAGAYQFLVVARSDVTYTLSISPEGGPRVLDGTAACSGAHRSAAASADSTTTVSSEFVLSEAGTDPLADATDVTGAWSLYLPVHYK